MPTKSSARKSQVIAVRVTPKIKEIIVQVARSEGLDVSEWIRHLIVSELRRRGILSPLPTITEIR